MKYNHQLITSATLEKFNKEEEQGYKEVFYALYQGMVKFSRTYTCNTHLSQEVVIGSFVKLFRSKKKFGNPEQLRAFTAEIVKNETLNLLKARAAISKKVLYVEEYNTEMAEPVNEPRFTEQQVKTLYQYIDLLTGRCKTVILLSLLGMSGKEIAQRLSTTVSTVDVQKHRALNKLKKYFGVK